MELSRRALANGERLDGAARHARVLAAAHRLGQLHLTLSQMDDAIDSFALAEKAAEELEDVEARVNAICAGALARFHSKRTEQSKQEAERALAIARAAGSTPAAAAAELVLALQSFCFGQTAEAQRDFEQSVPILRQQVPPIHALEAIGFSGLLYAWQLEYDVAQRAVDWTLRTAREVGSPYHTIMNLFVRGMALFNQGRLAEGLADLEEGMRLAEHNDERYWLSRFPNTLGWALRELGDWDRAHALNRQGAAVAHEHGYGKPEANSHLNLAQYHLDAGEMETASRICIARRRSSRRTSGFAGATTSASRVSWRATGCAGATPCRRARTPRSHSPRRRHTWRASTWRGRTSSSATWRSRRNDGTTRGARTRTRCKCSPGTDARSSSGRSCAAPPT